MPIGYLIAIGVPVAGMAMGAQTAAPVRPARHPQLAAERVVNESPFVAFYWVLAVTLVAPAQGDLESPAGWVGAAIAAGSFLAAPVLVGRSLRARATVDHALDDALGPHWRARLGPEHASQLRR